MWKNAIVSYFVKLLCVRICMEKNIRIVFPRFSGGKNANIEIINELNNPCKKFVQLHYTRSRCGNHFKLTKEKIRKKAGSIQFFFKKMKRRYYTLSLWKSLSAPFWWRWLMYLKENISVYYSFEHTLYMSDFFRNELSVKKKHLIHRWDKKRPSISHIAYFNHSCDLIRRKIKSCSIHTLFARILFKSANN